MNDLRLPKTKAALAAWDEAKKAWDTYHMQATPKEEAALGRMLDREKKAVQDAFAEETADRNDPVTAAMVHPKDLWLRSLVEKYG